MSRLRTFLALQTPRKYVVHIGMTLVVAFFVVMPAALLWGDDGGVLAAILTAPVVLLASAWLVCDYAPSSTREDQ